MGRNLAYILCVVFICSCKGPVDDAAQVETMLSSEEAIITPIKIHVRTQTLIPKPKIENAVSPTIVSVDQNKQLAGDGMVTPLSIVYEKKVAELPKPDVITPKIIIRKAELPDVNAALPFKTREKNPYNLKYWDVEEGLKESRGRTLLQTKDGLLWYVNENCLTSFDGNSFNHYRPHLDDSRNGMFSIFQDPKGDLWYGNDFGCGRYDGVNYYFYKLDSLHPRISYPMCCDKKGNIWCAVSREGLVKFDGKTCYFYTTKNGLAYNDIRSVFEDSKGNMWFGGSDGSITKYDGTTFTYIDYHDKTTPYNDIGAINEDLEGNMWFGLFTRGVAKFDGKNFHRYKENGLRGFTTGCITIGNDGLIYFSTGEGDAALNIYDGKYFYYITTEEGLNSRDVSHATFDNTGNLWLTGGVGGLMEYDKNCFRHYATKEVLGTDMINCIVKDGNNDLLFSTTNSFMKYANDKFYIWQGKKEDMASIRVLCEDKDKNIWLGKDYKGLTKFDGQKYYTYTEELPNTWISELQPTPKGDLWIGTNWGPTLLKDGKFIRFEDDSMITKLNTSALYQDKKGRIWIGTGGAGFMIYDGKDFYKVNKAAGFQGRVVSDFAEDDQGNMWITTADNGIFKYDGKKVSHYTKAQGLSGNTVVSCLKTSTGDMWFGLQSGVAVLKKKEFIKIANNKDPEFINYGPIEGFKGASCRRAALAEDRTGKIWWGTFKMLTCYDPENDKQDVAKPKMIWKGLQLFGKDMDWQIKDSLMKKESSVGIEYDSAAAWTNMPISLSLPYHQNHLTFHFAGIDFKSYRKIKYSYILDGLESKWSLWSTDASADYKFLPAGKYTFKVKSKNKDHVESELLTYSFVVRPPWWKTKVAYTIYGLLAIGIIFGYNRMRTNKLLKRQKELEFTVDERTQEIANQKKTVEEKQKEIVDSINYAQRIQFTLLAHEKVLKKHFDDHFVLFQPKDIVSGDFYWATKAVPRGNEDKELFYLAVCDSTGHGVPGAFMSLLNISFLNEAINEKGIHEPDAILNYVRDRLVNSVSRDGAKDGMDGILVCFESNKKENNYRITYSAGNNAPLIYNDGTLEELPFSKMPIGKGEKEEQFSLHIINAKKGNAIYLYTDGYADQFGGPKGKKFKYKQLNEMLLGNANLPMKKQKDIIQKAIVDWKGEFEQVDDICVIGIRL